MVDTRRGGGFIAALAWLTFPAAPVVFESLYNGVLQLTAAGQPPLDPRDWDWLLWASELGPLVGFAFLAGATLDLPDEPTGRRGLRAWLARRSVWVAVGPWAGFLAWAAVILAGRIATPYLPSVGGGGGASPAANDTWTAVVLPWLGIVFLLATLSYAWLLPAVAVVRRARRAGPGRAWRAVRRGVGVVIAFVGSLFGTFWAITEGWRSYFFDPKVFPVVLAALSLCALEGCASNLTYGDVRRRDLFRAMLLAWVFGLALFWLWWSRPRRRPPSAGGGA